MRAGAMQWRLVMINRRFFVGLVAQAGAVLLVACGNSDFNSDVIAGGPVSGPGAKGRNRCYGYGGYGYGYGRYGYGYGRYGYGCCGVGYSGSLSQTSAAILPASFAEHLST
jgi:hypothetical protein